jgi:4-hydroxy-4-methyl-2-oxoglutarate aldolase
MKTVVKAKELQDADLRRGAILLDYEDRSAEDHMPLVKKYEGLRVTDVLDALQAVGIRDTTMMDHSIRPLWRDDSDEVSHRIYGVAITFQYLPTNRPEIGSIPLDDFNKWHGEWYRDLAPELFAKIVAPGTVAVIDAQGIDNTGFIGSNNGFSWITDGLEGIVTNGPCRDTDELIIQKVPVYSRYQGGGTRPGRIESGSINLPVCVGGVLVRPGDMVVADGDGVVIVPREYAEQVAEIAWQIAEGDKKVRKGLYKKMGMEPDKTV